MTRGASYTCQPLLNGLISMIAITADALHFLPISVNVHANMIQPFNGQSHSEPKQSKPKGRFTGERVLRERPRVYRKVVELLAEPGMSINQITKLCRVSEHTVRAVRDREAISIAERKQRLMSIFGNVAEIAAERMEELAGTASLRDAGTTAGIATDKLLALSSDPLSQANQQHLHVHLQPVDLIGQWNEMIRKLPSASKDTAAKALPSGPGKEATQPTTTTKRAERCAREEKDRTKRELTGSIGAPKA
jgi:hypothetical protein